MESFLRRDAKDGGSTEAKILLHQSSHGVHGRGIVADSSCQGRQIVRCDARQIAFAPFPLPTTADNDPSSYIGTRVDLLHACLLEVERTSVTLRPADGLQNNHRKSSHGIPGRMLTCLCKPAGVWCKAKRRCEHTTSAFDDLRVVPNVTPIDYYSAFGFSHFYNTVLRYATCSNSALGHLAIRLTLSVSTKAVSTSAGRHANPKYTWLRWMALLGWRC